jgi:hypothetical protein
MAIGDQISSKTLREFLGDSNAPDGYVYFSYDEPFVQIDLFKKYYILFWLGAVDLESLPSDFSNLARAISLDTPQPFKGSISIKRKCRATLDRDKFVEDKQPLEYRRGQQNLTLKKELSDFISPFAFTTTFVNLDLRTYFYGRELRLTFWGDTIFSPKPEKEMGITSNLPLSEAAKELLRRSSSINQTLSGLDFHHLMELIEYSVSGGGYYL